MRNEWNADQISKRVGAHISFDLLVYTFTNHQRHVVVIVLAVELDLLGHFLDFRTITMLFTEHRYKSPLTGLWRVAQESKYKTVASRAINMFARV